MLEQEKRKILNNYLCAIDSLVTITRDSCELYLYATQQGTLDVACKYINELNEFLSHWDE